jgi:hypothetical protein
MEASVSKHRLGFVATAGKAELATKCNVIFDPVINLNHKLVEIVSSYKATADNLWSVQPDGLD